MQHALLELIRRDQAPGVDERRERLATLEPVDLAEACR